jgi:hypothetical protein
MEQDGTQLQFKSVTQNAYVAAENGGGGVLIANRPSASGWETFKLWRIDQNTFNLRVFSNQFVSAPGSNVAATAATPGSSETFQLVRNDADKNRMRIRAPNGNFLQVLNFTVVDLIPRLDYNLQDESSRES